MSESTRIVLCSEWFPPAFGGSAELLANTYARVMSPVTVVTTSAHTGGWQQRGQEAAVHRMPFPKALGILDRSSGILTWKLARALRRIGGAGGVVHCGRVLPEGTAAMIAAFSTRAPYVCWTHGEELPIIDSSRELRWLARHVYRRAAAIVANSQHTADLLARLGHAEKVHVIRPAVDPERFHPRLKSSHVRETLARGARLVLLAVGRLQSRKGHDLTLRALAALQNPELFQYVVVGDGPEAGRLRALARDLGIDARVTFTGPVSAAELPAYYASADIFVHPNRVEQGDFEGFGIVFLEAAASGIPSVGGRSGGVPESVEDGRTGILVSGDDVGELRNVLERLAGSPDLRASLGHAARARVLQEFTWERAARQVDTMGVGLPTGKRGT